MHPKLRTRKSEGYTKNSRCNTNHLFKMITFLNNNEYATITMIIKAIGGSSSIKSGLQFLRSIKIIEKVYNPNINIIRGGLTMVYRLSKGFKILYNDLGDFPEEPKTENIIKPIKINKWVIIGVIHKTGNKKYPLHYISLPIQFLRETKLQKGDTLKLKPLEASRLIKIKEF